MVWSELCEAVKPFIDNNPGYFFDETKEDTFYHNYQHFRDLFIDKYMKKSIIKPTETDRHKNAAIIVCALIKTEPVLFKNDHPNKKVIINEKLSVNLALSYMYSSLCKLIKNETEKKNGCNEIDLNAEESAYVAEQIKCGLDGYCLPVSYADHNENFASILASEIYYAKEANQLFPVTLANMFFLIECHHIQALKTEYYKEKCGMK
jgi:hypothetical protein